MDENIDLVIDASFVLSFLLPDEQTAFVLKTFKDYHAGDIKLISSPLLPFEVLNGLKAAYLRKRLTTALVTELADTFFNLRIAEKAVDHKLALRESLKHNISYYDAAYLALAKSQHLPLYTLDKTLQKLAA